MSEQTEKVLCENAPLILRTFHKEYERSGAYPIFHLTQNGETTAFVAGGGTKRWQEGMRSIGVALYHSVRGVSEHTDPSYAINPYPPLDGVLGGVINELVDDRVSLDTLDRLLAGLQRGPHPNVTVIPTKPPSNGPSVNISVPTPPIPSVMEEQARHYESLRTLFGTGFCGIEEVMSAFTLHDGTTLAPYPDAFRVAILKALWDKCQEPDVVTFLSRIKEGKVSVGDWLLILRIPFLKRADKDIPLTMKVLQEHIAPDMQSHGQGKLLYSAADSSCWYTKNEAFYDTDPIPSCHWQFVTKACVEGTKGKEHAAQATVLNKYAKKVGLIPNLTRRRKPMEISYDHAIMLREHDTRLLVGEYDWTDTRTSNGNFVHVGDGDARGLFVNGISADDSNEPLGACLSR